MPDKVSTRKWARKVMAQLLAEEAQMARANEADLVEFGKLQNRLARADQRRETVIAAATTRYREVEAENEAGAGAALKRLHARGMGESQLCAITGLTQTRLRHLLHIAAHRDTTTAGMRVKRSSAGARLVQDERGARDHPAQTRQAEDTQRDGRGPHAVLEGPRPMPGEPDEDAESEPQQSVRDRAGWDEHDRQQ